LSSAPPLSWGDRLANWILTNSALLPHPPEVDRHLPPGGDDATLIID